MERGIYRVSGINTAREMNWKQYLAALLVFNAFGFVSLLALLMTQQWLPLNPAHIPNMSWHLALSTAVSFMTNTNWQSYNGEVSRELPLPDGGTGGAQLPERRHRHGRGARPDPRDPEQGVRRTWATSGST